MKKLDFFRKPMSGLYVKTGRGGLLSLLSIGLSVIAVLFYLFATNFAKSQPQIGIASFRNETIPFTANIIYYNENCEDIAFHLDNSFSAVPSIFDIKKEQVKPLGKDAVLACDLQIKASLYPTEGSFHFTPDKKGMELDGNHRHIGSNNAKYSLQYAIKKLQFGSEVSSIPSLLESDSMQPKEINSTLFHVTYDMKVYSVKNHGKRYFTYSASEYAPADQSSLVVYPGLFFRYSFQPEELNYQDFSFSSLELIIISIVVFGASYSFFIRITRFLIKEKGTSKLD